MPERPSFIKKRIAHYINDKVPHFFIYAKDKDDERVADINNSFVNKLDSKIPDPRISCKYTSEGETKKLGKPDYTLMMSNPKIKIAIVKNENGKLVEGTNPVILKYIEKAKEYWQKINATFVQDYPRDALTKTQIRKEATYNTIVNEVKYELSQFGYNEYEVTDILVRYLYGVKESKYKDLLWTCYGEYILESLEKHFKLKTKVIQCIDCGEWFEVGIKDSRTNRCEKCYKEYRNSYIANFIKQSSGMNETKTIICCDCGKEFEVSAKNTKTTRCSDCYYKHRRKNKTATMHDLRAK